MSGEWSTGKKFGDDAPNEELDPDNISLMNSGACGAFIHGLEDEYLGRFFVFMICFLKEELFLSKLSAWSFKCVKYIFLIVMLIYSIYFVCLYWKLSASCLELAEIR